MLFVHYRIYFLHHVCHATVQDCQSNSFELFLQKLSSQKMKPMFHRNYSAHLFLFCLYEPSRQYPFFLPFESTSHSILPHLSYTINSTNWLHSPQGIISKSLIPWNGSIWKEQFVKGFFRLHSTSAEPILGMQYPNASVLPLVMSMSQEAAKHRTPGKKSLPVSTMSTVLKTLEQQNFREMMKTSWEINYFWQKGCLCYGSFVYKVNDKGLLVILVNTGKFILAVLCNASLLQPSSFEAMKTLPAIEPLLFLHALSIFTTPAKFQISFILYFVW